MGSLMAGWDSPVLDPQVVKYQRNRSYTKGEIEAYWRSHGRREEEHLSLAPSQHVDQENIHKTAGERLQRSSSLPLTDRKGSIANKKQSEDILDEFRKTSGWWTRSTWAFLNEPPIIEMEPPYKYPSKNNIPVFGGKETKKYMMK